SSETATAWLTSRLANAWRLEDAGLRVEALEIPQSATGGEYIGPWVQVTSKRIFLDEQVVEAALRPRTRSLPDHPAFAADKPQNLAASSALTNRVRMFTYLANLIQAGSQAAPYSMVTAADSPIVPADMADEEILVNEWLAEDLQVKAGDPVQVSYYLADSGSALVERTNVFRVRAVVPIKGFYADRSLMPEFPGLAKAERTQDWDAGFDLTHEIRDKDEAYWKQYRGTPKAFITLAAGQKLWGNRFGELTAIRYAVPTNTFPSVWRELSYLNLLANLHPSQVGLTVRPVRAQALAGAGQGQDFGQLFLGFSFFLVMAALLLMALMFRLGLEQRAEEIGICLAMGLTGRQVRQWLLWEGSALALAGSVLGVLGGVLYARAMLWGLATVWRDAIGSSSLAFSVSTGTLVIGFLAGTAVGVSTIALGLRRFTRQPARELLAGRFAEVRKNDGKRNLAIAVAAGAAALGLLAWAFAQQQSHAGAFFGAAALVLVAGIALAAAWLKRLPVSSGVKGPSLGIVGLRACARRPSRSLSVIALLACGTFLIGAIGVFRQDARRDATRPGSGTGGFALIGESALPLVRDLNTQAGRETFGLEVGPGATAVRVVPFRIREGDEASCLNLGRAQRPRLAGVNPDGLSGRFTFKRVAAGLDKSLGWQLLRNRDAGEDAIPAIGDANSIQWALGKKLGDTLEYTDERGRSFKIRIAGAVANSVLQGMLIIDEQAFVEKFPGESGYRWFLVDAPAGFANRVAATWSRALEDYGMELTPATERLDQFNAVQNTYLGTFQLLGGLGLLLGIAGVGIVLFRNVLERRGELAVLTAMGFRRRTLARLLLSEHGALMAAGLGLGLLVAALAVLPAVLSPGEQLPWISLGLTLGAVAVNGLLCVWLATRMALRGSLLAALRNE
ncbi:MAG TPA: ABC transporter permease, partial [Clostridia bacterium]|nr:ABC transporter permease [Clostridia bacterium]